MSKISNQPGVGQTPAQWAPVCYRRDLAGCDDSITPGLSQGSKGLWCV